MYLDGKVGYQAEHQVYAGGKWWPWVRGYNNSNSNGYAGVIGKAIQAVRIRIVKV